MDFNYLLKIWVKNIAKSISKNISGKYSQKLRAKKIVLKNLPQMHLKQFQKESFKK